MTFQTHAEFAIMDCMIELKNLTKKFGGLTAVDNLSLSISAGEIYGFIGPNGAGKTTTIKILAGLLLPTSGEASINGFNIAQKPEQAKKSIGYIPDDPYVYERMTGYEFLHFIGELWGMREQERVERIETGKNIFPLAGVLDGYMENYSRGNKQKTVILAALLHRPKTLLIDEPIVGLDPESATTAKRLFRDFAKKEGGAVFLTTHTLSVAEEICDRVGIIKGGKLIAEGTLKELHAKAGEAAKTLEEMYLALTQ